MSLLFGGFLLCSAIAIAASADDEAAILRQSFSSSPTDQKLALDLISVAWPSFTNDQLKHLLNLLISDKEEERKRLALNMLMEIGAIRGGRQKEILDAFSLECKKLSKSSDSETKKSAKKVLQSISWQAKK